MIKLTDQNYVYYSAKLFNSVCIEVERGVLHVYMGDYEMQCNARLMHVSA